MRRRPRHGTRPAPSRTRPAAPVDRMAALVAEVVAPVARMVAPVGRAVALIALGALTALAGCGLGGGPREVQPDGSEVPGIVGRDCHYANPPDATPPLSRLIRAGTRGNIALWGRGMGPADSVEISVRYADDGRLQWVEAIRSTVPRERAEALEDLVLRALDEAGPEDWGVRLRVVAGDVADVLPSVICPPRARRGSVISPGITDRRTFQEFSRVRGRRIPVRVTLDERGSILSVELVRRTGSDAVNQYIIDFIWGSTFYPKLHDGIGAVSTLEIDITFPRRQM